MWGKILGLVVVSFLLGITTQMLIDEAQSLPTGIASINTGSLSAEIPAPRLLVTEQPSPSDWIQENQIHVSDKGVVIDIEDPEWATFINSNSMDPILDETSHAIQKKPTSSEQIHVGDIISYKSERSENLIIHRVVEVGNDGSWYAIAKGDNNPYNDPEKIRFSQIQRVLIAIIY